MNWKSNSIITSVLVVGAVIIAGFSVHKLFADPEYHDVRFFENWEDLPLKGQVLGQLDAEIQIVMLYNYKCPYCKQMQTILNQVHNRYRKEIVIYYMHLTPDPPSDAYQASIAAECAAKQDLFLSYHNLLFENSVELSTETLIKLADKTGIPNLDSFEKCINNHKPAELLEHHKYLASILDIDKVPTFIINGNLISGVLTLEDFSSLIENEL